MDPVDAWLTVAERIAGVPDASAREALLRAVASLGLTNQERAALAERIRDRSDPAAVVAGEVLARAGTSTEVTVLAAPAWSDAALDKALDTVRSMRRWVESGDAPGAAPSVGGLEALPPDDAAELVVELLREAWPGAGSSELAHDRAQVVLSVLLSTSPLRLPAADVLSASAALPAGADRDGLLRGLALVSTARLLRGAADALAGDAPPAAAIAGVLDAVGAYRRERLAQGPYRWWREAEPTGAEVPDLPPVDDALAGDAPDGPPEVVWRGIDGEPGPPADRAAHVRLDVMSGTEKPDVVVVDQAFEVILGLQPRRDRALVVTPAMAFATGETVELEAVLLYDPGSIEVTGSPRSALTVSDATPYPTITVTCVARYGEQLATERRLGVQLLREGQVVAVAWRTLVAVDDDRRVAAAAQPPVRQVQLLDLDPLLGEQAPDLVVSVSRADADADSFIWTTYAADPAILVPDLPSATTLDGDVAGFALETRRSIQFSTDAAKDYLGLAGRARRIARAVPQGVQDAIRAVVEAPGRSFAPTLLLLTEELTVPWELASFEPPLSSDWGGGSPFLGAHVAVARWPLTEHHPRPRPRSTVTVRSGAVLTADYTGVQGWGRLESAVAEAAEVARLFDPPATPVEPEIWSVIGLFRGTPPGDVLHVALHGQFDAQGDQEGIVLLARDGGTAPRAQFLTPAELENGRLDHGPFVFLNACQVGNDERVLGDYGGFASTLLRIGAAAVVAPLWNVRDDVAAAFARSFYAAAWTGAAPVPIAEAVRALRATYTEEAVRRGDPGLHATLVAYQVFGHPRMRLTRDPAPG